MKWFLFALLLLFVFVDVMIGYANIGLKDIIEYVLGDSPAHISTILDIRLGGAISLALVGIILAISGNIVQTIFLNPIAEPYIIGISGAGAFGTILPIILGLYPLMLFRVIFAFAFSMGIAFALILLKDYIYYSERLILVGVITNAFFGAMIIFVNSIMSPYMLKYSMSMLMGGFIDYSRVSILLLFIAASILVYFSYRYAYSLDSMLAGYDIAITNGVDVVYISRLAIVIISLSLSFVISFAGMIGFVGLVVPHIVKIINGNNHRKNILYLIFFGAIFLIVADIISKSVISGYRIAIGVITTIIGTPFFIYILLKRRDR